MTISLKHATQSAGGPYTPTGELGPTAWNEEHALLMATARILGRVTAATGAVEELTDAQVRTFINVADGATANTGDVTAASSFGTDNRIVRSDGTGKGVQASNISVDDDGKIAFTSAGVTTLGSQLSQFELNGSSVFEASITLRTEAALTGGGGYIRFLHNNASNALPATNNRLGVMHFGSLDGTTVRVGAGIVVYADGTWTTGAASPGRLSFETTPTGSLSRVERMRIHGSGLVEAYVGIKAPKRITSETSSATPTINTDNCDIHRITALAVDITSLTTNLSGTPSHGQELSIEFTGTATRAITHGASFEASSVALPTTTSGTAMLKAWYVWNSATSKWRVVRVA